MQKPTQKDAATVKSVKSRTKDQPNREIIIGRRAGLTARLTRKTAISEGAAPRSRRSLRIGYQANIGPVDKMPAIAAKKACFTPEPFCVTFSNWGGVKKRFKATIKQNTRKNGRSRRQKQSMLV